MHILQNQLNDTVKASLLQSDGTYSRVDKRGKKLFNSQEIFCREAIEKAKNAAGDTVAESRRFVPQMHHE